MTDMLKQAGIAAPPKTFEELAEQAKIIKDKGIVKFPIVWSWAQAEALICDYTLAGRRLSGHLLRPTASRAFDSGGSLDAVKYMKKTLDDGLTNPNSREYLEEDVRKVFSSGEAAFALNWTYMYNLANDPKESKIAGKVGIVPAPGAAGKTDGFGGQRLDGPRHRRHQPARRRGLEVHHLHDRAGRRRTNTPSSACRSGSRPTTIRR